MKHLIRLWCHASATLLVLGASGHAATLTVSPSGQGLFPTLQSAIDAAAPGDTVLALPGTFSGLGNRNLDFGGKDLCLIGRDGSAYTTINCEHLGRALTVHSGETKAALLKGFRIASGGNTEINAGAVLCENGGLTARDLWVSDAEAGFVAGIAIVHGAADLQGIILDSCSTPGAAGGIGLYWADSTLIRDCIISDGSANGYGGGIEANNSSLVTLEAVHFVGNHAGISGGGLSAHGSEITVVNCLFSGNDARDGAGISVRGSTLDVQNSTFIGNYASRWGAALYYDSQGEPSGGLVENCDFRGNNGQFGGIIVLMNEAYPVLRRLSIVDNNHGDGIDAGCCAVTAVIEDCLIAFNRGGHGIGDDPSGGSWLSPLCSNVFGNELGEYEHTNHTGLNGNISEDPLLCVSNYETLGVADGSPCLPENNACGVLMGNHGAECTLTAVGAPAPPGVDLEANYPNPFNPSTTIPFSLSAPTAATLTIHDVSGRLVRMLADARSFPAGHHELRWDGRDGTGQLAPSGVYFYRLETPAGATARAMLLVK
jgi:hypothetical protein